jgi:hypothetical protein
VVAVVVAAFGAEWADRQGIQGKKGEAEFRQEEEAVCIWRQTVIGETPGEGVHGHASGGRKEGREDVKGIGVKVLSALEKSFVSEVVVELALETTGWGMEHEVGDRQGALVEEKVVIIDLLEYREVVTESADDLGGVAGCFPGSEPFRINGCQFVDFVAMSVGNALCCVADGSDERDKESGVGCFRRVTKAETAFGHGEKRQMTGKEWERAGGAGNTEEEVL